VITSSEIINQALVTISPDGSIRSVSSYFYRLFGGDKKNIYELVANDVDASKLKVLIKSTVDRFTSNITYPVRVKLKSATGKIELFNLDKIIPLDISLRTSLEGDNRFNIIGSVVTTDDVDSCALIISNILGSETIDLINSHVDRIEITRLINSQISHELRSPLSSFNLNLGFLEGKVNNLLNHEEIKRFSDIVESASECKKVLHEMNYQIKYVENILNNLSNYSKLMFSNLLSIDFGEVVESTTNMMRIASDIKNLRKDQFQIDIGKIQKLFINSNTVYISQIIWNLCMNAYEAITSREKISVIGSTSENYAYLRICNPGKIDDNIIERIFDPYVTTKFDNRHQGLGLCIVKSLVEKSNGVVWVTNPKLPNSDQSIVIMNLRFLKSNCTGDTAAAAADAAEDEISLEELELLQ